MHADGSATAQRRCRRFTIHQPWAWVLWPHENPPPSPTLTETASTPAEEIEAGPINLALVSGAVHAAVRKIPVTRETLRHSSMDIDVALELTDPEFEMASSWLGKDAPVAYDYEHDQLTDDRDFVRRTHATHLEYGAGVPLLSGAMSAVSAALHDAGERTQALDTLTRAAEWWEQQPDNWGQTKPHQRMLALAYLELTDPDPVSREWFDRLSDWDNTIEVLTQLHREGRTDARLLQERLILAWRYKQDRTRVSGPDLIDMFRTLGFQANGWPAKPPKGSLTLYRGAVDDNRAGPSWTLNPAGAEYFAHARQGARRRGQVWKATIPASRVLAYLPDEREFIVDLAGLEHLIHEAGPGEKTDRRTRWKTKRLQSLARRGY